MESSVVTPFYLSKTEWIVLNAMGLTTKNTLAYMLPNLFKIINVKSKTIFKAM